LADVSAYIPVPSAAVDARGAVCADHARQQPQVAAHDADGEAHRPDARGAGDGHRQLVAASLVPQEQLHDLDDRVEQPPVAMDRAERRHADEPYAVRRAGVREHRRRPVAQRQRRQPDRQLPAALDQPPADVLDQIGGTGGHIGRVRLDDLDAPVDIAGDTFAQRLRELGGEAVGQVAVVARDEQSDDDVLRVSHWVPARRPATHDDVTGPRLPMAPPAVPSGEESTRGRVHGQCGAVDRTRPTGSVVH
jgi:hypothetical protein